MHEPRLPLEAILDGTMSLAERSAAAREWLDENLRTDPRASRDLIDGLLPEVREAGDAIGAAWLQFHLGWLTLDADAYDEGQALLESVRSRFEELGDQVGVVRTLNALGAANLALGIYDLALDCFRESAEGAERLGRHDLADAASMNIAECLYELDEPAEALQVIEHCRKAYTIAPHNIPANHHDVGLIYRSLGRLGEAEWELLEAVRTAGEARRESLEARQSLAEVYIDAGRKHEAWALVNRGMEECAQAGERTIGTRFRLSRARLLALENEHGEAIRDLESVVEAAKEIGSRKIEADAEKSLFQAWQARGDCRKALDAYIRHARIKDTMRNEQTSRRIIGLHDERIRRETRHFENLYKQIATISEIGQRITSNLDLDATLESLYGAINSLMDAPTLLIGLVNEEQACLDYRLVMIQGQRKPSFSRPLSRENFGCWCVNHRSDILIGDVEAEYRHYTRSYGDLVFDGTPEKSLVFVPLFAGEKVTGMLSVQSHIPHAYDRQKLETIRAIGSYIAIAVENAKLFQQVHKLAMTDALTGLLNRRQLMETIEEAYRKNQRYMSHTGILMIDVDHFKNVNDTHGHEVGDKVLRAVAGIFAAKVRDCDSVGRFGGEEFLVVLPETGLEGARKLAERLRKAVAGFRHPLPAGGGFGVTASFGVSVIHPEDPTHEAVLKRADEALYHAKQAGRNRVVAKEA